MLLKAGSSHFEAVVALYRCKKKVTFGRSEWSHGGAPERHAALNISGSWRGASTALDTTVSQVNPGFVMARLVSAGQVKLFAVDCEGTMFAD